MIGAQAKHELESHHELGLRRLSDCFAGLAHEASHILNQLRWHSGKPDSDSANDT